MKTSCREGQEKVCWSIPRDSFRPGDATGRRAILAADTGEPTGHARWQAPAGWWRFLVRGVLQVRELEDEPLLCLVRRRWTLLPWYEVCDADEQRIGRILGPVLQDRDARRCATRCSDGPGQISFQTPEGILLARVDREPEGDRLTFETVIEKEPFVKMLLLGGGVAGLASMTVSSVRRQHTSPKRQRGERLGACVVPPALALGACGVPPRAEVQKRPTAAATCSGRQPTSDLPDHSDGQGRFRSRFAPADPAGSRRRRRSAGR